MYDYQKEYSTLDFEDDLRNFRFRHILNYISKINHGKILEIGCGQMPLFESFSDFDEYTALEPWPSFYKISCEKAKAHLCAENIEVINDNIENAYLKLPGNYDVIYLGGFLHEIANADEVVKYVGEISNKNTTVISFVPNVNSFHRLLAKEAGIISSVYDWSEHDKIFGRKTLFTLDSFSELFERNGLEVIEKNTYFIKPFNHSQMSAILASGLLSKDVLKGLFKMSAYMPDYGAEIFIAAKTG